MTGSRLADSDRVAWPQSVPLAQLVPGASGRVTGLSLDSRTVQPGDLYVALPGLHTHGAQFVPQAVAQGAVAVLTDQAGAELAGPQPVPVVPVATPRTVMATWAADLAGRPAERMLMLAVTGTNGKTTTAFAAQALLNGLGRDSASLGTLGCWWQGQPRPWATTTITTPESPQLQLGLAALADAGCQAVVMEVSSHALDLHRVDAITFAASGFINLGRDHLDYHGDLASYFAAKAKLFEPERSRQAVINLDDPAGQRLAATVAERGQPLLTVGRNPAAQLRIVSEQPASDGRTSVVLQSEQARYAFDLSLPGAHNVTDAALAVGLIEAAGLDPTTGLASLAQLSVPGRLQRVDLPADPSSPQPPRVYVDFAHTPEAVSATLAAVNAGPTIAVVGAGGDRDPGKRAAIGAAAARAADCVIVTDDNPRYEDPALIRQAVLGGATAARAEGSAGRRPATTDIIDGGDRRSAIGQALAYAGPGTVVVILGKGHETFQDIAGRRQAFSDAAVVLEQWNELRRT
ncbi:MAG: UDP-N-acetylmuramoyl-L-alanyl-D-glutamate--2,6-diaminopimelate ligase [Propionibacteriaceae bacterium]|jgi:UDP-N-acetylmuramoyl-L-alanyl-D-glutamate--2,6-diaminopimelate ligase|nr:UDP-N-acetylmuramoyl-L-alanyl-D-glutamate--2,6-diaminopimelate ligase [Propionibacteriaceae bacterium]